MCACSHPTQIAPMLTKRSYCAAVAIGAPVVEVQETAISDGSVMPGLSLDGACMRGVCCRLHHSACCCFVVNGAERLACLAPVAAGAMAGAGAAADGEQSLLTSNLTPPHSPPHSPHHSPPHEREVHHFHDHHVGEPRAFAEAN